MGSIEQVIRIGLYTAAGYLLGDAVAQSAEFQGAVSGLIGIGTFAWWFYKNRKVAK